MSESYEVEVKAIITDSEEMKQRLLDIGAEMLNSEIQIDTYYDHPCRSFQETDEAIRVRTRRPLDDQELDTTRSQNELTYKGPKVDKKTKTRLEYSVGIDKTDAVSSILQSLDFKPVAVVTKKRIFFDLRDITISVDDVEQVGQFLELESIVHKKDEMESAKSLIFKILNELGIDSNNMVRDSYLELYLSRK
ncbi:MAG: class IV adenylate cyclase [Candidatus Thorarchaeota archaeon]